MGKRKTYDIYPDDWDSREWRDIRWTKVDFDDWEDLTCCHRWTGKVFYTCRVWRSKWLKHHPKVLECRVSFIRKTQAAINHSRNRPSAALDVELREEHPAVFEFLCTTELDGEPRETATLNISWSPTEGFKAFMNDRASRSYVCVTSETLAGLLGALDAKLRSEDPGWRESKEFTPTKKKKS